MIDDRYAVDGAPLRIAASGIVTNEYNDILLIQRDDTLTWSAPGGSLEPGELPTDGVAREVKEETGMYVLPVRLVAASFSVEKPYPHLHLTFRCLIRGGEPTPSPESPQVAFFKSKVLPRPMFYPHRQRIERAHYHAGPAIWYDDLLPWYAEALRSFRKWWVARSRADRRPAPERDDKRKTPLWTTRAYAVAGDGGGKVLWRRTAANGLALPGGVSGLRESPWQAAARLTREQTGLTVSLHRLSGLYVRPASTEMVFVFSAAAAVDGRDGLFLPAGEADPLVAPLIADARSGGDETAVSYWPAAAP